MSAGLALQLAIVRATAAEGEITGTFDGAPTRAAYPYLVIDAGNEGDWSHKTGDGREVLMGLTLWDDQPARLQRLAGSVEARLRELTKVEGWQLVTLRFTRRRVIRDVAGPWAVVMDFRARLLVDNQGEG